MQKIRPLLLTLLVIFAISACKKESEDMQIVGEWEFRSFAGGLLPSSQPPSGKEQILKFSSTDYQYIEDGKLVKNGSYQIIEEEFWDGNHRIVFDNDLTGLPQYLKISDDKLTIFIGAPISLDGAEIVYERK